MILYDPTMMATSDMSTKEILKKYGDVAKTAKHGRGGSAQQKDKAVAFHHVNNDQAGEGGERRVGGLWHIDGSTQHPSLDL